MHCDQPIQADRLAGVNVSPSDGRAARLALGRATHDVWREIWQDIEPLLDTALGGDQGTFVESQLLIMERNGYPEETYYTFSYSPIPNDDGTVGGIFCANSDDTQRVIGERQLALLRISPPRRLLHATGNRVIMLPIALLAAPLIKKIVNRVTYEEP